MPYTLQDALNIAATQKKAYQDNLMGKYFAYAYIDKKHNKIVIKEVEFKKKHFLHLTGLDYKNALYNKRVLGLTVRTHAEDFFDRLGKDNTLIQDVSFIQGSTAQETMNNFNHAQDKIRNLPQLTNIAKKAELIGAYKDPAKFDLVINRNEENLVLLQEKNFFVPVSSRYGKPKHFFEKQDINDILAIFSKERIHNKYNIVYLNKNVKLSNNIRFDYDVLAKFNSKSFESLSVKLNVEQQQKIVRIFENSVKNSIAMKLKDITELREKAFLSEPDMNTYINATKIFRQNIENKEMFAMAIDILKKDLEECPSADNKDLINDEISKLSELFPTPDGLVHIVKFENELPKGQAQGNTLAVSLPKVSAPQTPNIFDKLRSAAQTVIKDFKKLLSEELSPKKKSTSKTPQNKTKSTKAVQKKEAVKKPVEKIQSENVQEPEQKKSRFCKADLKSEKYAPRSQKKDRSVNRNRNDLEH